MRLAHALLATLLTAMPAAAAAPAAPAAFDARDLSGVWFPAARYQAARKTDEGKVPEMLPWAQAEYDRRVAALKAGKPIIDNVTLCIGSGPRMISSPYPLEILQSPKQVTLIGEWNHEVRRIYMNEPHPKDVDPTYFGHSSGRWEGDTLVVDTIGFNDKTLFDETGLVHTDALHVVEYVKRVSADRLEIRMVVEDPKTYPKPWTVTFPFRLDPSAHVMEFECNENNRNLPDANGVVTAK